MKVAIVLSGLYRDYKESIDSLKENISKPLDADIFIHTCNIDNDLNACREYIKYVKPLGFSVDEYQQIERSLTSEINVYEWRKFPEVVVKNTLMQFYSWWRCSMLKKIFDNYDITIRARTEITYNRPLSKNEIELAQKEIIIPNGFDHYPGAVNDLFAIGPSVYMDIYHDIYHYIPKYILNGMAFHPELLVGFHLRYNGIPYTRFRYKTYLKNKQVTGGPVEPVGYDEELYSKEVSILVE